MRAGPTKGPPSLSFGMPRWPIGLDLAPRANTRPSPHDASPPRPLDRYAVMLMAMLCGSWGFNQVAAKLALVGFRPDHAGGAAIGLGSLVRRRLRLAFQARDLAPRRDASPRDLAVGLLFALEFVLLFVAVKLTTAASAIVFIYTAPFFVALGARRVSAERAAAAEPVARHGARLLGRRGGSLSARGRVQPARRSARDRRRRRVGRDDDSDQDDVAAFRRPDQDAALSNRHLGADLPARRLCRRRAVADRTCPSSPRPVSPTSRSGWSA